VGRRRAPIWGPPQQEGLGVKSEVCLVYGGSSFHHVACGGVPALSLAYCPRGMAQLQQDVPESRVVGPIHYSNMRKRGGGGQSGRRECSSTLRTHGVRACVRAHVSGGSSRHCTPEDYPKRIFVRGALLCFLYALWRYGGVCGWGCGHGY